MAGEWDVVSVTPAAQPAVEQPTSEWDVVDTTPLDPGDRVNLRMDNLDRSIGTIASDIAVKAASGANAMVGNLGTVYGLATGDMDNPVTEQAKSGQAYWEKQVSPQLKAQEAGRRAAIDAADGEWAKAGTAIWETLKNPALLSSSLAEQAAQLVPMAGAGKLVGMGAKALGAGEAVAGGAAVAGGVGAGAAMQGADTGGDAYDRLMALPDPVWAQNADVKTLIAHGISPQEAKQRVATSLSRDSAAISAIASGALNLIPGARVLEKSLAGIPAKGAIAGRVASGLAGEGLQEGLEEGSGMVAQNRAVQTLDPNQSLTQGAGEAAGLGAVVGGPMGGVAGLSGGEQAATNKTQIRPPSDPTVEDLMGEPLSTPTPDGGTVTDVAPPVLRSNLSPADQRIREIRDAVNAGRPVPPGSRGQLQEVPVEDVELAPPPAETDIAAAAQDLYDQMREPAPAANIDVQPGGDVTQVELAPPPVEQPTPVEPPASNIDVSQPFDDIENIDAAPPPQPQRALPPPSMAVDSQGNAQPQSQADQARREFTQKERVQVEQLTKRAAKLEAQGDTEGAIAIRRELAGYTQPEGDNARAARSRTERLPPNWTDNRLARSKYRYGIRGMAEDLVKGGDITYTYDENGKINGRTPSVNPDWFQGMNANPDTSMSTEAVKAAVEKALAGKPLGVREARVVGAMIDTFHGERGEQVDYAKQQLEAARKFRKTAAEAIGITDEDVERAGELLNEREYRADWDGPTRSLYEMADEARAVDPDTTQSILESSASDADVARQLAEVIHGRTQRNQEADPGETQAGREIEASPAAQGAQEARTPGPQDGAVADKEFTQERDEFGPGQSMPEAIAFAESAPAGQIALETSVRPSGKKWHHAYVSLGDGEYASVNIGPDLAKTSRKDLLAEAEKKRAKDRDTKKSADNHRAANVAAVTEKGIKVGVKWEKPFTYTQKGRTEYDWAQVESIDSETGVVSVIAYKRGMRSQVRLKVQADSHLFDNYPATEIAPYTAADLAAREQQKRDGDKARQQSEQRAQADDQRGSFTLTGSDRTADEAAARGQQDLLDPPKSGARAQLEAKVKRPKPREESVQDKSNREWRENYDRVVNASSLADVSTVDLERAEAFATRVSQSEKRKGWDGGTSDKALIAAFDREIESFKDELKRRRETKARTKPAPEPQQLADKASKGPDKSADKIEDFGSKLEGARKDYATRLKEARDVDIAKEPLSKSWPEPDYQNLLDSGTSPWVVAWAHAVRDEISTKPAKPYKLKAWVAQVSMLRGMAEKLISGEWREETAKRKLSEPEFQRLNEYVGGRADLYLAVGHETSLKGIGLAFGEYGIYEGKKFDKPKAMWTVEKKAKSTAYSNWPTIIATGDSRQAAIDAFKSKVGQIETKEDKSVSFQIYSYRSDPKTSIIGKKVGKTYIDLKKFDSVKEAREYLAGHHDELTAMLANAKATPNERRESNEPRVGIDHRGGVDVTPDMFTEAFGFRGVQFGNYVQNDKRQADLNDAYDALMDLAGVIGVPPRALSLNGELGLAFGARGKGGKGAPSAHYEPTKIVINLTKERGAGALAHEWWHSLDNYFSRQGGDKEGHASDSTAGTKGIREEMLGAFRAVRGAVNNAALKARATTLDDRRSKPYWSTKPEMSARAFEAYVVAKLQDQSRSNDYLANIVSEDYWNAAEALFHGVDGKHTYPYPTADEIPAIRAAFDEFFRTVETRETDKGVGMFSKRDHQWGEVTDTATGPMYSNDDVTLFPAGVEGAGLWENEAVYSVVDNETGQSIGEVVVGITDGQIDTVYWIESYKKGAGTRIMRAITANSTVTIDNIMDTAKGFWDKLGIYDYDGRNAKLDYFEGKSAQGLSGGVREGKGNAGASGSRSDAKAGLSPEETRTYLEEKLGAKVVARLIDSGIVTISDSSDKNVPEEIRQANREGKTIFGYYDGEKTWLFSDRLNKIGRPTGIEKDGYFSEDAFAILMHEVGVHFGMYKMLGPQLFRKILDEAKAATGELGKAWAVARKIAVDAGTKAEYVDEEALAWMVTDRANHELPLIKRVIAKIRAWLLSKGFVKAMSADALVELARGAADKAGGRMMNEGRFAAKDTDAFKRWFGSSTFDLVAPSQTSMPESGPNRNAGDAKSIPNLLESKAFRLKGLGGLDIPSQRKVLDGVISFGNNPEILDSIVNLIPVDVMNILVGQDSSAEMIFHDRSVLKNLLSSDGDGSVSVAIKVANSLVGAVARVAAKRLGTNPGMTTPAMEKNTASSTDIGNGFHDENIDEIKPTGNNGNFDPSNSDIRFARRADQIAEALDRPAIKKGLKQWYKDTGAAVVNAIDTKLTPLATMAGRTEYLTSRYLTLGRIAQTQQEARRVYDMFRKLSDADGQKVYAYLTDTEGTLEGVDATTKANATRVKHMIEQTGQALVERGVIPQESFDKYQGRYLPRVYLAYLLGDKAVAAVGAGKTLSAQSYAKSRDENLPQEYRDIVLGEIKDPAFLASRALGVPLRDLAILNWLSGIAKNPNWVLPGQTVEWTMPGMDKARTVTPYWLKSEATRLRERAQFYQGQNKTDAMQLAAQMDEAADAALSEAGIALDQVPDGYKQVPNSARYGAVRGLIVVKDIYDDIVGVGRVVSKDASLAENILGYGGVGSKITGYWKWAKVAANPPAQIRNVVSNMVLLQLSGVPMHKLPGLIARAAKEVRTKGKFYQVGLKYGVTESTFAAQEMQRIERETANYLARMGGRFSLAHLKDYFGRFQDWTGDMYQASEMLGKVVKIMDSMEREGKSEGEAAMAAQEWLFDYSLVGQNVRYLRSAPIGAPFLTFAIKVLPRILEVAITHPARFLPYAGMLYASSLLVQSLTGADDDDLDRLKKALPEWLQENGHVMMLPVKDEHGRWQFVDVGYFFPWTYWTGLASDLGGAVKDLVTKGETDKLGKAMTGSGLLGGPIPDMLTAIKTGKDSFTGRDIIDDHMTAGEKLNAMLTYLYGMAMPPFLTGIPPFHDHATSKGAAGHIYEALTGTTDKRGEPRSTVPQALLRLVGVNVYGVEPEKARERNIIHKTYEISKTVQLMRSIANDKSIDPEDRDDLVEDYKAKILRQKEALDKYKKESVVAPELR